MIEAGQFVEPAKRLGFDFWAGVPCSFLTPFINYTIGDSGLTYVSAANEGDAVAISSGAVLGGRRAVAMMQNSGLGNAVSPLTSLNYVFRIPVLLIVTLRGEPGRPDEPQHELMGQITPQLLETMQIPWRWFPEDASEVEDVLALAVSYMDEHHRPFALIMRKGAVAPHPLRGVSEIRKLSAKTKIEKFGTQVEAPVMQQEITDKPTRHQVLSELITQTDSSDCIVLASTGYTGRELFAIEDRPNHLYMVGSMGCVSSLGLGLALARPDKKVIVVDGDGAALMRMGNFATVGAYARDNYYQILLDNGVHESTGGQYTVSPAIDFAAVAAACGYQSVVHSNEAGSISGFLGQRSPALLYIQTRQGVPEGLLRPTIKPFEVARRLMQHIQVKV
jgi:phosphonopyruvate decarboxylase